MRRVLCGLRSSVGRVAVAGAATHIAPRHSAVVRGSLLLGGAVASFAQSRPLCANTGSTGPPAAVASVLRDCGAVCFDVDSTVITVEGIDELAAYFGKKEEVAKTTKQAMEGGLEFRAALEKRLEAIQPTKDGLAAFMESEQLQLAPGLRELVQYLHAAGLQVFLVSGGFTQMINPVADELGIPRSNVFANTILFDEAGGYAGFDTEAPTSRSGGKQLVVSQVRESLAPGQRVVMVGDGQTDLEAEADAFVGYGGVVERPVVRQGADWFVHSHHQLTSAFQQNTGQ